MKKALQIILLVSLLVPPARSVPAPVAGSPDERALRLERDIDRASEAGAFARVQPLRLELAQYLARTGNKAAAARQYELILASRPPRVERVRYFIELGRMRHDLQNYSGAINAFQDALHDDPKSWDAHWALAQAYAQVDLNIKAVESCERCIALRPSEVAPYQELGMLQQKLGYLNKAIGYYQKALALRAPAESYLGLADVYTRQGDLERAMQTLQKGKTSLPQAEYDVRLGDIYHKRGSLAQAIRAWEEALASDRKRDDVRLKLILAYDKLGRRADNDRLLAQLTAAYPRSPLVHFVHAWVFYSRGDRQRARQESLKARSLAPSEVVGHFNERLLDQL